MSKQIITIGYEIPGRHEDSVDFKSTRSLMDSDIVLFRPNFLDYAHDPDYNGKSCYSQNASFSLKEDMHHWEKELGSFLRSGKTVFLLLSEKTEYYLHSGQTSHSGSGRSRVTTNLVELHHNYEFLSIDIGDMTSANGKQIAFTGHQIFSSFYKKFKDNLAYQVYVESSDKGVPIFVGKDKTKVLGAMYKIGPGHLITLPMLTFDEESFTEIDKKGQESWNKQGVNFGNELVDCLLEIDKKFTDGSERTPAPSWISQKQFLGIKEENIHTSINANVAKIEAIKKKNEKLNTELQAELELKNLLYEQATPLEDAVIKALKILGYEAENYDDGELEMDQVIIGPEKRRYIGECEGKDSKDINISKFRQLMDSLNADFARDEVEEKAFGILFGNPQRLLDPKKRNLDFTTKCKSGAKREGIALVRTIDLFIVAKYLNENVDEKFKKDCRDAIHSNLGTIVKLPTIPIKK